MSKERVDGLNVDWIKQTRVHRNGAQFLDGTLVRLQRQGGAPFACTRRCTLLEGRRLKLPAKRNQRKFEETLEYAYAVCFRRTCSLAIGFLIVSVYQPFWTVCPMANPKFHYQGRGFLGGVTMCPPSILGAVRPAEGENAGTRARGRLRGTTHGRPIPSRSASSPPASAFGWGESALPYCARHGSLPLYPAALRPIQVKSERCCNVAMLQCCTADRKHRNPVAGQPECSARHPTSRVTAMLGECHLKIKRVENVLAG